ncbi:MAG: hypothetical protein K6E30_08040 [Lachnospiraceae bacterium]|nr:hypothetical protein [Lachnospiraceae bacterium]
MKGALMGNENRIPPEAGRMGIIRLLTNLLLLQSAVLVPGLLFMRPPLELFLSAAFYSLLTVFLFFSQRLEGFGLFVSAHLIAALGSGFLLPGPYYACFFPALFFIWASFSSRADGRRRFYPSLGLLLYPIALHFLGKGLQNGRIRFLALLAEAGLSFLYILYKNAESLEHTFLAARKYVRVPYRKMSGRNSFMLICFMLPALALSAILAALLDGEALLSEAASALFQLYMGAVYLIYRLLCLLPFGSGGEAAAPSEGGDMTAALGELQAENPLLERLWLWAERLFLLFSILILLIVIRSFVKSLVSDIKAGQAEGRDIRKKLARKEKARKKGTTSESRLSFFDQSEEARVRRLYIRYLKSQPGGRNIRPSEAPEEQLKTAACVKGDPEEVRAVYEEARYGRGTGREGLLRRMRGGMG